MAKKSGIRRLLSAGVAAVMAFAGITVFAADSMGTDEEIYQGMNTLKLQIQQSKLCENKGTHPRLLMNARKLEEVKLAVLQPGRMQEVAEDLLRRGDAAVQAAVPNPADSPDGMPDSVSSASTNHIPTLAMAYRLSGEQKYLDAAQRWIRAICGYSQWEANPDLYTGHGLMTLALAYDWLYGELGHELKETMRQKMLREGEIVYAKVTLNRQSYWNREWLQNHMWIAVSGMAAAGMALYDERDEVLPWLEAANKHMSTAASVLPKDGGNHEGIDYWFYGMESLFMYAAMSRDVLGTDMLSIDWFEKASDFLLYNFLPRDHWGLDYGYYFTFGDCTGSGTLLEHMLRLIAREEQDSTAQWLGDQLSAVSASTRHTYLTLLWYDGSVPAISPLDGEKPLLKHFDDLDYVAARSGWNGNESALMFHCGPPMGHNENRLSKQVSPYNDWGGGHVHPDSNSFLLFGNGELLLRDDDYASTKYTRQHSTLTIDNMGQLGEGEAWLNTIKYHEGGGDAWVEKAESLGEMDHIVGDAAQSYPASSGVKKFRRHLLYLKPDVLIVIDDIELTEPKSMQLRFWPERQNFIEQGDGFLVPGERANLKYQPLTMDGVTGSTETSELVTRYYTEDRNAFKLEKNGTAWQNAVALSWSEANASPKDVQCIQMGDIWRFTVDGQEILFRFSSEKAALTGDNRYQDAAVKLLVDGRYIQADAAPQIMDGRTMVPLRSAFEALGAQVEWDEDTGTVRGYRGAAEVLLRPGEAAALVNGETVELESPAFVQQDRTYVPMRFLAESLGAVVEWDGNTNTVRIISPGGGEGTDSALSAILVSGKKLDGFSGDKTTYQYTAVGQKTVPAVVGISRDPGAFVTVEPAAALPGQTTIRVKSGDGTTETVYTVALEHAYYKGAGLFDIVDIQCSDPANTSVWSAVDQDIDTYFAIEGSGVWIQLDLGEKKEISQAAMAFYQGNTRYTYFEIWLSDEGETWRTVYDGQSANDTLEPQLFSFPKQTARYVRFVGKGNSASAWNSYSELGIYDDSVFLQELTMERPEAMPRVGDAFQLTAKGRMSDGTDMKLSGFAEEWTSSAPDIATMDGNGRVTFLAAGEVKITLRVKNENQSRTASAVFQCGDGSRQIPVQDDAYTIAWRADENFGNMQYLEVRNAISNSGVARKAYMKFDCSELQGEIEKAELCFHAASKPAETGVKEVEITVYSVLDDSWQEETLTERNKPFMEEPLGGTETTEEMRLCAIDVTDYVRSRLRHSGLVSFGLLAKEQEGYAYIRSREVSAAGQRPFLQVTMKQEAEVKQ